MSRSDTTGPGRPVPSGISRIFLNRDHGLRNGWWVAIFLAVLAGLLFPTLLISSQLGHEVSIWEQALLIGLATVVVQFLRRKPVTEVTGPLGLKSLGDLGRGLALGFLLMALPAAALWFGGWVRFDLNPFDGQALLSAIALMAGVAAAEELLFRGVIFQRLIAGVGVWPAQVAVGLLFVLTHLGNPGMDGDVRLWAGANIFVASLLFGQAFIRTRGLALPIGLHFMANLTQGALFGFGVSGNAEPGLLSPEFMSDAAWLTGGAFGLEAGLPLLVTCAVMFAWLLAGGRAGDGNRRPS